MYFLNKVKCTESSIILQFVFNIALKDFILTLLVRTYESQLQKNYKGRKAVLQKAFYT